MSDKKSNKPRIRVRENGSVWVTLFNGDLIVCETIDEAYRVWKIAMNQASVRYL